MSGLAFTKDKNQIATPWHIVEFLSELLETQKKRVLDPTAGNGAMLQHAGIRYGIELDEKAFKMLEERYTDGEFLCGDVFQNAEWIKQKDPEVVLMNPPFNVEKSKGLAFVQFTADVVDKGMLAAIVPIGSVASHKKYTDEIKKDLLEKHTLEAVLLFNNELFYPAASASVVCLIFRLGQRHSGKTWFADFSEDGLVKDRTKGRIDKDGKWQDVKAIWHELYTMKACFEQQNALKNIPCEYTEITYADDWNPKSVIPINPDCLTPTTEDFYKTVREYMDWRIKLVGLEQYLKENPHLLPPKEERIKQLQSRINELQKEIDVLSNES